MVKLLNQLKTDLKTQPYLLKLYQALFSTAYFGLLRVGEITTGSHPILVKDVELGKNKRKIKFTLHSSKTHNRGNTPQIIKISSMKAKRSQAWGRTQTSRYCPYALLKVYLRARRPSMSLNEPFFVLSDRSLVTPELFRNRLRLTLRHAGYNPSLFGCHSFRIGRCGDLLKLGLSVETIKKIGRWKSNAVFRYFKS